MVSILDVYLCMLLYCGDVDSGDGVNIFHDALLFIFTNYGTVLGLIA